MIKYLASIAILFLISCSTSSKSFRPQSSFDIREYKLENGLTILIVEDDRLPAITYSLMVKEGVSKAEKLGTSALLLQSIDKGTSTRTASEISDAFGELGTDLSKLLGSDNMFLHVRGLSFHAEALLNIFTDVILNPRFDTKEIERAKTQLIAKSISGKDNPSTVANVVFEKLLFSTDPYGRSLVGKEKEIKKLTRRDVIDKYKAIFTPNNSIFAVVGRVPKGLEEKLKEYFKSWNSSPSHDFKEKPKKLSPVKVVVNKNNLAQVQVRVGMQTLNRAHPDHLSLQVASQVLGGSFSSRLMEEIRIKKGLTYNIQASQSSLLRAGYFEVSSFTKHETASELIQQLKQIIDEFIQNGITQQELDNIKGYMLGQFTRSIETAENITLQLLLLRLYGLSDDELWNYPERLNSLTLKQVNTAIRRHIKPDEFSVVIYGSQKKLGGQFLGYQNMSLSQALARP